MPVVMKKEKPLPRNFIPRRFKRVPLKIKFRVNGRDLNGNQFEESVESKDLGSNGGSVALKYEVRVGSTLKLTGPKGFISLVRVVWVLTEERSHRYMVGFQLLEPREDWVLQSKSKAAPLLSSQKKTN
jgi:hypothetical protein